ncbi:MAG: hypothetical protein AB7G08_31870 [Hyphomicrobiaceae bacterium]
MFIDNINRKVDSGELAAVLTAATQARRDRLAHLFSRASERSRRGLLTFEDDGRDGKWRDRVLGKSEDVEIPVRCAWVMAGNNLSFTHELMRRNVPIRLDAAVPRPEDREKDKDAFKHRPLQDWVLSQRRQLVWSCHILVLNWVQAGKPSGSARLASFDTYVNVMGGILQAAGVPGFLENVPAYLESKDDDGSAAADLVGIWADKRGTDHVTAGDILGDITDAFGRLVVELPDVAAAPEGRKCEILRARLRREVLGATFSVRLASRCASRSPHAPSENVLVKVVRLRDRNPIKYALIPLDAPEPHAA